MVALAVVLVSAAVAGAVILAVGTGSGAPADPEGDSPSNNVKVHNYVVNVTDSMEVEDTR